MRGVEFDTKTLDQLSRTSPFQNGKFQTKGGDMKQIKVLKNPENPETKEILAEAIVKIGEAADKLKASGLNEDAIVVLLHDKTGVPKKTIKAVLDGLRRLRGWYCR